MSEETKRIIENAKVLGEALRQIAITREAIENFARAVIEAGISFKKCKNVFKKCNGLMDKK